MEKRVHGVPENHEGTRSAERARGSTESLPFGLALHGMIQEQPQGAHRKSQGKQGREMPLAKKDRHRTTTDERRTNDDDSKTKRNDAERTPTALKLGAYSATIWIGPARHDPGAATGRAQEKPGKTGKGKCH